MIGQSLSDRARSWLTFAVAGNLALILIAIWVTYSATHVQSRYVPTSPGETITVHDDEVQFRLIKMTTTEVITDTDGESYPSDAGTSWVIAELELTMPRAIEYPPCTFELLAAGNLTWEVWDGDSAGFYERDLPLYCDEPKPRQPYRFEQIFQVPNTSVDQIYGVFTEDTTTAAPVPVLRT